MPVLAQRVREPMNRLLADLLYRHQLMAVLGRLRIRGPLRRTYCRWFGPEGGTVPVGLGALCARFYAHSERAAMDLKSFGGERQVLELLVQSLSPGDTVYDVGAELGLYSVFLGQRVGEKGRIFAFEPESHACERLLDNLSLNHASNVRVFRLALGEQSGEAKLLPAQTGSAPRLAGASGEQGGERHGQSVEVVEGDQLVQREGLPLPRLVKVDVEGLELAVLRGLRRTLSNSGCEMVCCEVHPRLLPPGANLESVVDLLRSFGFSRIESCPRAAEFHVLAYKESATRPQAG